MLVNGDAGTVNATVTAGDNVGDGDAGLSCNSPGEMIRRRGGSGSCCRSGDGKGGCNHAEDPIDGRTCCCGGSDECPCLATVAVLQSSHRWSRRLLRNGERGPFRLRQGFAARGRRVVRAGEERQRSARHANHLEDKGIEKGTVSWNGWGMGLWEVNDRARGVASIDAHSSARVARAEV